jgi:hypothetical protein
MFYNLTKILSNVEDLRLKSIIYEPKGFSIAEFELHKVQKEFTISIFSWTSFQFLQWRND